VVPIEVGGVRAGIDYAPAESTTAMFGGNFNWRGPLWLATTGPASAHQTGWTGLVADLIRRQHGAVHSVGDAALRAAPLPDPQS
jgi:hypothetical protein